jgi:hypothetical protein
MFTTGIVRVYAWGCQGGCKILHKNRFYLLGISSLFQFFNNNKAEDQLSHALPPIFDPTYLKILTIELRIVEYPLSSEAPLGLLSRKKISFAYFFVTPSPWV